MSGHSCWFLLVGADTPAGPRELVSRPCTQAEALGARLRYRDTGHRVEIAYDPVGCRACAESPAARDRQLAAAQARGCILGLPECHWAQVPGEVA